MIWVFTWTGRWTSIVLICSSGKLASSGGHLMLTCRLPWSFPQHFAVPQCHVGEC